MRRATRLSRSLFSVATVALTVSSARAQVLKGRFIGSNTEQVGFAVEMLGDLDGDGWQELLIGAPYSDATVTNGGRAYIVSSADGSTLWSFYPNDPGAKLGWSVAALGDQDGDGVPDFAIGEPSDSHLAANAGRVRVLAGNSWSPVYYVDGSAGDLAGFSIASLGDVTGDGIAELLVGRPGADAVDVYDHNGSVVYTVTGASGSQFGYKVAAAGDCDADGWPDFAVGAPYYDSSTKSDVGRAYVFSGRTGALLFTRTGTNTDDHMGVGLSRLGDVDGDRHDDLLIGTPDDDSAGTDAGVVRCVSGKTGATIYFAYGGAGDRFGRSIACIGDANHDGFPDVLVGAPDAPGGGLAVTMSGRDGTGFFSFALGTKHCGFAVAGGDLNGDGYADVIVGDPGYDHVAADDGAVFWLLGAPAYWENYGAGWPGTYGEPLLTSSDDPSFGASLTLNVGNSSPASAFSLLFVGLSSLNLPTAWGGTLLVSPLFVVPFVVPFGGTTLSGQVPSDQGLANVDVDVQILESDPGASDGVSFSKGLRLHLGFDYP